MEKCGKKKKAKAWLVGTLISFAAITVMAGYQTKVYMEQGGDEQVVASGGKITVQSGGTLSLEAGSEVTGAVSLSSGLTVTSGGIHVSSGTGSGAYSCQWKGAFQTLPTSAATECDFAYQLSDHKLYVATETVVSANSWLTTQ